MLGRFLSKEQASSDKPVELRKFPYPYKAMLAISTDIDCTTEKFFRTIHRFINTRERTEFGQGLGLDVANSFWFFDNDSKKSEIFTYFEGHDWTRPRPNAGEYLTYLQSPWIDTLHTYGNFNKGGFTRKHAEAACELSARHGLKFPVWVNHGNKKNSQNLGIPPHFVGDDPQHEAYHADLLKNIGVCYMANLSTPEYGVDDALVPMELADGQKFWSFHRYCYEYDAPDFDDVIHEFNPRPIKDRTVGKNKERKTMFAVWHMPLLHRQLSKKFLDKIVEQRQFVILGQHLGAAPNLASFAAFTPHAARALRRLKDYETRGDVLTASTSRLLDYNRAWKYLDYRISEENGATHIDILGLNDPVTGYETPVVEHLRGIQFIVRNRGPVFLKLRGRILDKQHVFERKPFWKDRIVGIQWHKRDVTDYTQQEQRMAA